MKTWHFVALNACSLLVGCGNLHLGSNTPVVEINETIELADYATLQSDGLDVYTALHSEKLTFISALPRGLMTYTGVAAFTTPEEAPVIIPKLIANGGTTADINSAFLSGVPGENGTAPTSVALIQVDVDFVKSTASGEITNIQHQDGYQITGTINIRNGKLVRNELTATFVGNLNDEGDQQIWAGDIQAMFVGSSAEGLYGDITGEHPGGPLQGGFVAQSH
jgi:hypothetical protein